MTWRKNVYGGHTQSALASIAGIILFLSFYQESFWLTSLGSLLLVYSIISSLYLNHVADQLSFENEKETIRISVGEECELHLKFAQKGFLPIYNATIRLKLESIVEGIDVSSDIHQNHVTLTYSFKVRGREQVELSLPLRGIARGASRIKSMELTIPNFFGFGYAELSYDFFIQKEILVYPTPKSVSQLEKLVAVKSLGDYSTPMSMHEQLLAPIGTRDYVHTDAFKQIHWKASAKTQVLQTKVYDKTAHYAWTVVINLRDLNNPYYHLGVVENVEHIASSIAFLVQYAAKKGIEFEMFINLGTVSLGTVYHLPLGEGMHQAGLALDALSRIQKNGNTLPIERFLRYVEKHQQYSPVMIVCGPFNESEYTFFRRVQKNGQKVYFLLDDEEISSIAPFNRHG